MTIADNADEPAVMVANYGKRSQGNKTVTCFSQRRNMGILPGIAIKS